MKMKFKQHLREGCHEINDNLIQSFVRICAQVAILGNLVEKSSLCATNVLEESFLKVGDLGGVQFVEESPDTAVDDGDLLLDGHGHVLTLLQQLGQSDTTVKQLLGGSIKIRAELGKGSDLTVLGKLKLHRTGHLLHRLGLGSRTDTGHGQTDVNGGTNTLVEQLGLQEDLSVSDGNDIGGDVGRHITGLGLNDGEGSQGTTAHGVRHLGSSLQQTGVKVENVTGVGLTTWGTSQQQRHLSVGYGLLGQVVKDDDSVHAIVSEVFTHGTAGIGGQVLQGSGIRGGGRHNDGVLHGVSIGKTLHNLGDGGSLLADGNVDTVQLGLGVITLVESLLVDDGVNGDGGFASLSVTNDQLTLSTANGDKGVDSLDTCLHGLLDRLSGDDTGGFKTNTELLLGVQGTFAVNGLTQSINNTAKEGIANGYVDNSTGTLHNIALLDQLVITEYDNTNVVGLQVKGHTFETGAEFHHLLCLDVLKTIDTSDTVTNAQHTASFLKVSSWGGSQDSVLQDGADFTTTSLGSRAGSCGGQLSGSHSGDGSGLLGSQLDGLGSHLVGHQRSCTNRCLCHLRSK